MNSGSGRILVKNEALNIIGFRENGTDYFRGIPYAEAPVGELRFAPPVPRKKWKETLDCTNWGHSAVQGPKMCGEGTPDEDCLNLNITAPAGAKAGDDLPVFFWIHGGGFYIGSGSEKIYHSDAFAKKGIILVTFNYRLGALGFLSLKTLMDRYGTAGNWGTLDQILALTWVKENIRSFGGDDNNITIGGESAGSFSCANLIASPKTKGLFQKAILESGAYSTILNPCRGDLDGCIEQGRKFASLYGADDSEEGLRKLREIDPIQLWKDSPFYFDFTKDMPMMMSPTYDGVVLPRDFPGAIRAGNYNKDVRVLAGNNAIEGALFAQNSTIEDDTLEKFVRKAFLPEKVDEVMALLKSSEGSDKEKIIFLLSMAIIDLGLIATLESFVDHGVETYSYIYGYTSKNAPPTHASEMSMVFVNKKTTMGAEKSKEDMEFSEIINSYWSNFIKNGDPNGEGLAEWPKYSTGDVIYLDREFATGPRRIQALLEKLMPLYFYSRK